MVTRRQYWSQRHGTGSGPLSLDVAARLFASLVSSYDERGYFQQWFGYVCVDADEVLGLAGSDPNAYAMRKTYRADIWPVNEYFEAWDEDALLTAVEFVHDHISKPEGGTYHSWAQCGWHYDKFEPDEGRTEYRAEVNDLLRDLGDGYELRPDGEVVRLGPADLRPLLEAPLPAIGVQGYERRVDAAVGVFRRRHSTELDRLGAVRELAAVLELLRPEVKVVMTSQDEADIFNLANNFGIRHLNQKQKLAYDRDVWLSWMFYYFLATIHAATRLVERKP